MAEYHAIEDTLYFMDRAIAASVSQMTLDAFLKVSSSVSGAVCVTLFLKSFAGVGAGNKKACGEAILSQMSG